MLFTIHDLRVHKLLYRLCETPVYKRQRAHQLAAVGSGRNVHFVDDVAEKWQRVMDRQSGKAAAT